MVFAPMQATHPGDLLTLEEVAAITRAPLNTVRDWIKKNKLASLRPGRLRLVRRSELEAFLMASETRSTVAPKQQSKRKKLP